MSLVTLQQRLQAHVLSGAAAVIAEIAPGGPADPARRLAVYSHGYGARLREVLLRDFPGLNLLAGETGIEVMLDAYIAQHPSGHFNIRWCGQHLPQFLCATAPWSDEPALAEMAAFEWALTVAFDAADASVCSASIVAGIAPAAWPAMHFRLQPGLQLLSLTSNVAEIRRALDAEQAPPALIASASAKAHVIWRRDFRVYHRVAVADEATVLAAVMAGASFGDMCVELAEVHAEDAVAARAVALLQQWFAEHWVSEVDISN